MKILVIDIETRPHEVYRWSLFDKGPVSLNQVSRFGGVMCFAAKWHAQSKVTFRSDFHHGHEEMVREAHGLIDQADVLVHYNGKKFDVPRLRTEFVLNNLQPPSPVQHVDLYQVVRSQFGFASNKLDHVASELGLGGKVKHSGQELWTRCINGDPLAWAEMRKYNVGDIRLTERVYDYLLPWITSHPNRGLFVQSDEQVCPNCGDEGQLQKRGFKATQVSVFQQYQCQSCGAWLRGGKAVRRVDERPAA